MRSLLAAIAVSALTSTACSTSSDSSPSNSAKLGGIAVNEISATGAEWLELYNAGSGELDLGAYAIADTDKMTGAARVSKAMRFPLGTKLEKGGFLLVLLNKSNSTPGPYAADACLPGVAAGCFYALFSISAARGEAVHLLAPDNTELSSTVYPANLAFDAGAELTACRLPDGTGDLTTCTPTPGAPNRTP